MRITFEQINGLTMNCGADNFNGFLEAIKSSFSQCPEYFNRIVKRNPDLVEEWREQVRSICAQAYVSDLIPSRVRSWLREKIQAAQEWETRWDPSAEFGPSLAEAAELVKALSEATNGFRLRFLLAEYGLEEHLDDYYDQVIDGPTPLEKWINSKLWPLEPRQKSWCQPPEFLSYYKIWIKSKS